jgi:hypothetical protein
MSMILITTIILASIAYILWRIYFKKENEENEEIINPYLDKNFTEKYVLEKIANTTNKKFAEILFEYTKKNFDRLNERFKFDDKMTRQILKDWCDYCMALGGIVFLGDYPDFTMDKEQRIKNNTEQDSLLIKLEEIEKRFKEFLGDDYLDPREKINDLDILNL